MHNLHMCVWWEQVVSNQLALIVMSVDIWKVLIDQRFELKFTPQEKKHLNVQPSWKANWN